MRASPLFQFHKGTIRTICSSVRPRLRNLFQFHKGTIRTDISLFITFADDEFQFHKGTIRTKLRVSAYLNHHFNSIKVQLELCNRAV